MRVAASAIVIDPKTATNARCQVGRHPAASAALPLSAPAMPPRLNMACMPLISGAPCNSSSCAASALMATSNRLVNRPKHSINPNSAGRPGMASRATSSSA